MKFKSLTSLLISAAMAASCMSGLAVTASAEEGSYTVSIGTITGGSIGDVMLVDPTATLAPTAAPEQTASPVTGLVPITESYAFIADNFTAAGAAAVAADTFFDGGKVYSALGNTVASNKQKSVINGTEYFNSLRLKGSQNYLEFIVGVNAEITVYSNIQNQSGKERAVAAGTTAGGTDMGHGEVEDGFFTFSAAAGTKVYLTGVNASDWATGGDMYIAGFTVTPAESMGAASVEASGAEALVSTLKANEGDTITVKAEDKALYDLTISTVPDVTVTAVEGKTGYYSFTMPAADTTVNAEYTANADKLPADQAWTSLDADLMAAASAAADGAAFGPVNGISGYGKWTNQASTAAYTHTNGVTYNFTSAFRAGSGGPTKRSFCFTPQQACIVTVAYTAQAGRPVYIYQGGTLLASGEDSAVNGVAATITADIEDPAAGDVIIYGGSSNKDIYGIFADYYDPSIVTYRNLSGNVIYSGAADTSALKLVFKDTKDGTEYKTAFSSTYTVDLCQNRTYDIYVEENGEKSGSVSATLDTNSISIAKLDKTFDINVVDIALTEVTGDVVVHDINNDGTSLDLSKVQLTFTADDNAALTYTTGITDNKLSVTMMPNHSYTITATGNDGYALSALSGSYLMAAGDTAPFKNILFTETLGEVAFSSTVEVGADKAYATVSDAITAIKAMTNRPAGEAGRVAVVIDPGTYVEQVIVDTPYVTLKAAYETNKPTITFYYGIGYLYYSSDGGYYSLDRAVQKTEVNIVARWGSTVRVAGANFIAENIIFENSLNCRVTPQELADGVTSAGPGWYGDVSGKPDRTVDGYDARKKEATERCAAFAGDAANYELYQCELIGSQDTLYTGNNGYFKDCYIEGGTDYIFGGNSVVFEGCTLAWHGYSDQAVGGYITACKTSDVPVPGTPNMNANGYLLKNCTITNSKYYTDNKFAAGSWGRNWGGANCQVVFDGITLDGVDTPGAWVKMGGELSASVLYVNDVTDKDGNAVNVSGTTYNPNGTMAANGYTVMDPTDYFGIWTPVHYTGEKQTPKPTADPGEKQTPKPTADPGEEQTPKPTDVPVTKLPANTSVVFDAGVTENEDGTKTGTSYTETAVFGNYVVVYADETHSIDIEASNKTINDTKYTARLKLGGKTTFTGEIPTERAISVTPAAAGTITIDFAHGSSSGDARTLTAYQNGAAIGSASATAGETATLTAAAAANMPVYILSVDGGINIYGINLTNSDDTVSCVKITATYGGNGALTDVAVENVTIPVSEAVPVTAGNVKTMYWESLESMKPITASSAPDEPDNTDEPDESEETVSPEAEANVIWKATAGVELQAGQVLAEGLSLVFGTDDTSKPVYTEFTVSADDLTPKAKIIGGVEFTGYVSSGANGSWSGTSIDPEKPTAIKYTAAADGILTVYLDTVASSKTICVGQDGMKKADIEAAGMIGPDAPVVLPVTVNAGSSYYIYVAGSKARFCGAAFEETVVKQIWRASSNDVGKTAGAELMPGLSIVADNSSTSANYVTAAVDPVWTEGVLSGAALKYTASANGTLTVSFVDLGNVDSVKTGVITDSEGNVIESYTTQGLAKESFDLSTEVTAGNIYYMYGQGTKARFSAVVFTPAAE